MGFAVGDGKKMVNEMRMIWPYLSDVALCEESVVDFCNIFQVFLNEWMLRYVVYDMRPYLVIEKRN